MDVQKIAVKYALPTLCAAITLRNIIAVSWDKNAFAAALAGATVCVFGIILYKALRQ